MEKRACAAQPRDTFQSCRNKACGNPLPKTSVTKPNTRKDTACLQGRGQWHEIRQTSRNKAASAQCRANFGMTWSREFAEQTFGQSRQAVDAFLRVTRKMVEDFESQATVVREHMTSLTQKTLSNT